MNRRRAGMRVLVGAILFLLISWEGWATERLQKEAPDGMTLVGELHLPPGNPEGATVQKAPLLVLLHRRSGDRGDWKGLIPRLVKAGYAVFAIDLRGHGESILRHGAKVSFRGFSHKEYAKMPGDLGLMLQAPAPFQDRVDLEKVGVIGASIGANVALVAAAQHRQIKALVLLSPGLDYWRIRTEEAMLDYGERPVLILCGEADVYAASSSRLLFALAKGPRNLTLFPTSAHGTNLLRATPGVEGHLLEWLAKHFPAR